MHLVRGTCMLARSGVAKKSRNSSPAKGRRQRTGEAVVFFLFFQAEDGIRDDLVTGVQTCALPISVPPPPTRTLRIAEGALPIETRLTEAPLVAVYFDQSPGSPTPISAKLTMVLAWARAGISRPPRIRPVPPSSPDARTCRRCNEQARIALLPDYWNAAAS